MLVHDSFIFLQLQKTACTHIAAELQARIGGTPEGKHQPLKSPSGARLIIGSVRNPWDWYVSLWAYGCAGKGSVHRALAHERGASVLRRAWRKPAEWPAALSRALRLSRSDQAFWQRVYRDPTDPAAFRAWLVQLLTTQAKADAFEDTRNMPMFREIGLYTARYARVFTLSKAWQKRAMQIRDSGSLVAYLDAEMVVDRFIRMEQLEEDLAALLCDLGHDCTSEMLRGEKRNASERRNFSFYHDAETVALIAAQDRLIAQRHGYDAPRVADIAKEENA